MYFEGLTKSLNDIVILLDPKTFQIQFINQIKPETRLEDVIGKDVFHFIYKENIPHFTQVLNELITTLKTCEVELEGIHYNNITSISRYKSKLIPIIDEQGALENILLISKDCTAAKLKEIEIANQEERLFAIINNSKDVILSIDKNLNITECNSVFEQLVLNTFKVNSIKNTPILNYIEIKKHEHLKLIYERAFLGENITDITIYNTLSGIVYFESSYNPILNYDKEIIGISIFSKNITERKLNEQKLQNSLKEREILLAEIHHRIKNNLALVSSMLQLKELSLTDNQAKEALIESRKRIKSTALVHEMLYRNDRFNNISINEYITELFENLKPNPSIELILEGEDQLLELNKASSFGLLMHELIMNTMKHSFKEKQLGQLKIEITKNTNQININYCDCSGKFPADVDFYNATSTGLVLIHTFIEQLNGSITLTNNEPPKYYITIPLS